MRCGGIEEKDEIFNHLTLSIHKSESLFDSLRYEVCVPTEIVCRKCTTCNEEIEWERLTLLGKSLEVLILHVNRFSWDCDGKKITSHIEFCHEFVMPTTNDLYRCYTLVVHKGFELRYGHYVCFFARMISGTP